MSKLSIVLVALLIPAISFAEDYADKIKEHFSKTKSDSYPAQEFKSIMPYEVGQWVMYGLTDDDGERSIMKYSIVGKSGDVWVLETWMMNEDNIVISEMHVKGLKKAAETGDVDDLDIVKVRMKAGENSQVSTIDGFVLKMAKGVYQDQMEGWFNSQVDFAPGGPVTVVGGSFAGTTKAKSEVTVLGDTTEGTSWMHPAVPIYGMVRNENEDGYVMELLDFGTSGATSSM